MINSASKFSFADCPGYNESVEREIKVRGIACLGINETICGIEVKPLNAAHIALLSLVKYPFHGGLTLAQLIGTKENNFTDGKPGLVEDIMRFLWIVSPMYEQGSKIRKHFWQRKTARDKFNEAFAPIMAKPANEVVSEILQYVDDAYLDTEHVRTDGIEKVGWAFQIAIAVELSTHHGYRVDFWSPDCPPSKNPILIPLKIVTQLRKYRAARDGQIISNRSDAILERNLNRMN